MSDEPRVVIASGHMVDGPDRSRPRFPPDQVDRVTREIGSALRGWGVGPRTTLVTGGARGADIIAAEESLSLGSRVLLCLARAPESFERESVQLPGTDWSDRFRALLGRAEVRVLRDEIPDAPAGPEVFERANVWMLDVAKSMDEAPHVIVVWNGEEGDGPGGTRDFVRRLGIEQPGPRVRVIDPTRRRYEPRQSPGPVKKLLALDGGGIRGVLTLEILRSLEAQLRERSGEGAVLSDFFDYIGGTSTGAIIAAGLALGRPVQELQSSYRALASKVFSKRWFPMWIRSLYRDQPLSTELRGFLGEHRTLGDPEMRALLLVVLHNTGTDSPWPLSNCTQAKYNLADRYLKDPPDRNLDLPLVELVRGSTAAPVYFPPQALNVGAGSVVFLFQDGGITPFNNPAFLMFLLATLPEYGLSWPTGEDRLLIVSVGTGSAAAVHPDLIASKVGLVFNAKNLPTVFMNGASWGQDLLCRAMGRALAGDVLDREVGALLDAPGVGGQRLFTYLRYNADLSDEGFARRGTGDPGTWRKMRKLDAVKYVGELEQIGREVGQTIDLERQLGAFL
jgi:hypothetical protein